MFRNRFIIALQESFIAIIPYFLLSSLAIFLFYFNQYFSFNFIPIDFLQSLSQRLNDFLPFIVLISIAYHFSIRYHSEPLIILFLSIAVFISAQLFFSVQAGFSGFNFNAIAIPLLSTWVMNKISPYFNIKLSYDDHNIYIYRIFRFIYSFIIAYIIVLLIFFILFIAFEQFKANIAQAYEQLSPSMLVFLRSLISQLFWFIGIHGPHAVNTLFNNDFLQQNLFPHLSYGEFIHLFTLLGGSGMGLSLIIALLTQAHDAHCLKIARLSLPFALFNINEILIFGLPIVFNPYLFLPFVFIPIFNIAIAWGLLLLFPVSFNDFQFTWTTPALINAYLISEDWHLVLMQLFIILLDALIYLPFVRQYAMVQSNQHHLKNLEKNLEVTSHLSARQGLSAHQAQRQIISSNNRLQDIIRLLNQDNLMLYYQPKVNIQQRHCHAYEALLRIRVENKVMGPFFIHDIEQAGLSAVIDLWVCQQVKRDMEAWAKQGFYPQISLNLHPETLQQDQIIDQIEQLLAGKAVEFEIIERALLKESKARHNICRLRRAGFKMAIDDFGVGYSSLDILSCIDIDTIKIDKSLIDRIEQDKTRIIIGYIAQLCQGLSLDCVAEGVEKQEQLQQLKALGIELIQGFYFAPALPPERIKNYHPDF